MQSRFARRAVVVFLCASLLAPVLPPLPGAEASQGDEVNENWVVRMEIGRPSIWSLAQAHYLLGQMHDRNRDLIAKRPDENALDPNRVNASRLEILRTLLGVEAQLDESLAVKNQIELDKFREKQAIKTQAQGLLAVRKAELQELDQEILELSIRIAQLETETSFAATPPSGEDRQRKVTLAGEKKKLELLQAERMRRAEEVTSLESAAIGDVATPTLSTPTLSADTGGATGALPAAEALTGFVTKALNNVGTPNLSASIALDNYVHIQYEIIAKQLTLLRDEVGPNERVVFLELPTSIYTVDKRANRFIAQVEWEVTKVYDEEPSPEVQREIICRDLRDDGKPAAAIRTVLKNVKGLEEGNVEGMECLQWLQRNAAERVYQRLAQSFIFPFLPSGVLPYEISEAVYGKSEEDPENWQSREYPITLDMLLLDSERKTTKEKAQDTEALRSKEEARRAKEEAVRVREEAKQTFALLSRVTTAVDESAAGKVEAQAREEAQAKEEEARAKEEEARAKEEEARAAAEARAKEEEKNKASVANVRTLEIIPRQSVLNVNQHHAKTSYKGILGALKFLSGFGAKVTYQRQQELYENFLQQEIFASGFGKGLKTFGWTFGPQPGSRRISPGQRTTYAVLAVPQNALGLELQAKGRAFRRNWYPEDGPIVHEQTFQIRIPNDKTERFWVESVSYTPVRQGPVTVLLRGNYFSPQLGVLVNGVPLKRSVSISRATISDPPFTRTNSGVEGEYEITNSHEMALNFSMGPSFVGTPIITLITPERATAINSFDLRVNFRDHLEKLRDTSEREPMFVDKLELTPKIEKLGPQAVRCDSSDCTREGFQLARLQGKGFLPNARISVGGVGLDVETSQDKLANLIRDGKTFAFQESTGSYLIYFKKPDGDKWKIRFQQTMKQGVEENEFEHVLPAGVDFGHRIRNYRRVPGGRFAEVDLTFVVPEARENPAASVAVILEDPPVRQGLISGCNKEAQRDGKDFRGKCRIPFEGGAERDFITLTVVSSVPKTETKEEKEARERKREREEMVETKHFVDIQLPVRPRVDIVANQRTGLPRADSRQDTKVILKGVNLNRVTGVLFGDQSVAIASTSPDVLVLQVPRLKVDPGQEISVPIVLQTDTGALATGFFFTYDGPPELKEPQNRDRSGV